MSTFVLSATVESPCIANALSLPSGDTAASPSPLVARAGASRSGAVGEPARWPVRPRALGEAARLPGGDDREPGPCRAAVAVEGVFGHGVRNPFGVGGELGVAHRLQRDEIVECDGGVLGREAGKR